MVGFSIIALLTMFLFLAMFIVGIVLIVTSRKPGLKYPSCGGCGYDLTGNTASTDLCPECGGEFTKVGIIPPQPLRRRNRLVLGVFLLVLPLGCGGVMTVGALFLATARQSTPAQAIAAQQQAMVQIVTAEQTQLKQDLASLKTQFDASTDETERGELQTQMDELQREIDKLDTELEQLAPESDSDP